LDSIRSLSDRIILISTTGVYSQDDHTWVDECSPCEPRRPAGQEYLAAERLLESHRWGRQSVILRMAGIYGPGRIPYLDPLLAGKPLLVDPTGYVNLIHVDDAARAVVASEGCELPNRFVVSDGVPVMRADYYREVGRLIGRDVVFGPADPHGPQAQRAASSKRVCNQKLISQLNIQLRYPSYREGLRGILGGSEYLTR
jgi:nucleoside-diphosphate-sugar epimerase